MTAEDETQREIQDSPNAETAKVTQELMDIVQDREAETQRRDAAWSEYQGYGEVYQRANAERAATGKIAVERYPEATLVAQIRVDAETGKALDGHDSNPESQSQKDIEAEWQKYLDETPADERYVIYEGGDGSFHDRDQAIRERADAGLTMYLADQASVERGSGEPTPRKEYEDLVAHGYDRDEAALYLTLRSIGASQVGRGDNVINPGADIYPQLAMIGMPGFREYSDVEKARISEQPEVRDALLESMAQAGREYAVDTFNPLMEKFGLPQFEVGEDGALSLPGVDGTRLVGGGPSADGYMGEMARANIEYRDRHILDTICDATKDGKKPFVVYGGSHVVALKPTLDAYFRTTAA